MVSSVERLLIDGNNLLHRLSGSADESHQRTLVARLRRVLPGVRKTVIFDGHRPTHSTLPSADAHVEVRHAGGSADDALVALVRALPTAQAVRTILVTDDRALTDRVRHAGVATRRLAWLVEQLDPAGPAGRRPAPAAGVDEPSQDEDERRPWQPGRGATRKKGNPRRAPRAAPRRPRRR